MANRPWVRDAFTVLASLAAIGAVTAALRALPDLSPTTAALALLLVVLGAATLARLRTAITVSILAMLALNFFFLPPVGRLAIADPQNWIALSRSSSWRSLPAICPRRPRTAPGKPSPGATR